MARRESDEILGARRMDGWLRNEEYAHQPLLGTYIEMRIPGLAISESINHSMKSAVTLQIKVDT